MRAQSDHDPVLRQAFRWRADGKGVALATVIETWGSAPRPVGSLLAVADDGNFVGSVSGGCVEGAVITEARAALADGRFRMLEFGVSDAEAWSVGLACGGRIRILVDPRAEYVAPLLERRRAGCPTVVATHLATGESSILEANGSQPLAQSVRGALASDRPEIVAWEGGQVFLNVFNPPIRLALVGAVHIAQPLCQMAALAGYAVTLIDPRSAFATTARFPDVALVLDWPDAALSLFQPDARSAIVTLSHDPKLDDPALEAALRSECFYIGALGSKKTHAARLARLAARGFDEASLARIHGPVGLRIGAKSPGEIAISILGEIIATLRLGGSPP